MARVWRAESSDYQNKFYMLFSQIFLYIVILYIGWNVESMNVSLYQTA